MMRVQLEGADYCDVPADLMTFDDSVVVFWRDGEEVGRHSQSRIQSLEVLAAHTRRVKEARKHFPNAFRPWTAEHQEMLTTLFKDGASKAVLTEALGRQPGGIETKLRTLGLLGEDEKLP